MRLRFAVVMVVATGCPAMAWAQYLTPESTGADYMAASPRVRAVWNARMAKAMGGFQPGNMARCLEEAMTPRRRDEMLATLAFKNTSLAELSALCAVMMSPR